MKPAIVLSIAGSDCSGGAGIQADIKTISALGAYAASAITAITAQNTMGVQAVHPLPAEVVGAQIRSVMDDLRPDAVKIGMVCNTDIVLSISDCLKEYRPGIVVYDPVMISTSGHRLMTEETVQAIQERLFPLCTLITPNLGETALLAGLRTISDVTAMQRAAQSLTEKHKRCFFVKGGHLEGDIMCDVLCHATPDERVPATQIQKRTAYEGDREAVHSPCCKLYTSAKIDSNNLHGTGCTLSSAIATFWAQGHTLTEAVGLAKQYVSKAIRHGKEMNIGSGNGPLWHFVSKDPMITQ